MQEKRRKKNQQFCPLIFPTSKTVPLDLGCSLAAEIVPLEQLPVWLSARPWQVHLEVPVS